MNFTAEQLAQIETMLTAANKPRKAKAKGGKKAGRTKLSDEQKAVNAKANAAAAEKVFTDAGYKNCVAHETIRTYGNVEKNTGWLAVGRKVKKGEKALRAPNGIALFHIEQTEAIAPAN